MNSRSNHHGHIHLVLLFIILSDTAISTSNRKHCTQKNPKPLSNTKHMLSQNLLRKPKAELGTCKTPMSARKKQNTHKIDKQKTEPKPKNKENTILSLEDIEQGSGQNLIIVSDSSGFSDSEEIVITITRIKSFSNDIGDLKFQTDSNSHRGSVAFEDSFRLTEQITNKKNSRTSTRIMNPKFNKRKINKRKTKKKKKSKGLNILPIVISGICIFTVMTMLILIYIYLMRHNNNDEEYK
eukprot:GAHX01000919.1.p1 GENE.GAHX01000919.1~~GAHX01000919.1.p1  ORF type:complete len:239 (+),score=30.75 GAHX01000919.1:91-807(+)